MLAKIIIVALRGLIVTGLPHFLLSFNLILWHVLTEEINLGLIIVCGS